MAGIVRELLWTLIGQDKAVANARAAATEMSRRRVEADAVELYLDTLQREPGVAPAAPVPWAGAPAGSR
jgi:hypothetical protein